MTQINGWSNRKEDVTRVKAPVYNASIDTKEEKANFVHQANILHVMNGYSID